LQAGKEPKPIGFLFVGLFDSSGEDTKGIGGVPKSKNIGTVSV